MRNGFIKSVATFKLLVDEVLDQLLQTRLVIIDDCFPYFFESVYILGGVGREFLALGRPVDEFHEVKPVLHLKGVVGSEDHAGQVGVRTRLHKVEEFNKAVLILQNGEDNCSP